MENNLLEQEILLALEESPENLKKLIEAIAAPVFVKDENHRFVCVNQAFCDFNNKSREELLYHNGQSFLPPTHLQDFWKQDNFVMSPGAVDASEYVLPDEKGENRYFISRKSSFVDSAGRKFVVGVIEDQTENKKMESELQRNILFIRQVINSVHEGIIVYDLDFRYRLWNSFMENFTGIKEADVIGKRADEVFPFLTKSGVMERLNGVLKGKSFKEVEFPFEIQSSGVKGWASDKSVPLKDQNGRTVGILGAVRDITEQKLAENAIIESNRRNAVAEIVSSVAHDFNNVLQSLFGQIELAMDESGNNEKTQEYLKSMKNSVEDAASRVLKLRRFNVKVDHESMKQLDVSRLLEEVVNQASPLWKQASERDGIDIQVKLDADKDIFVNGDEGELRSSFYNLLKNSIEAMPKGGLINLKVVVRDNKVVILISDNGIGMDNQTALRVFQPFFSTKGFEGGRGLGMVGVSNAMNAHGGSIRILHTAPGEGTTFEITLPVSKLDKSSVPVQSDKVEKMKIKPAKILIAEDEAPIQRTYKRLLESKGHSVDMAGNGLEALKLLENNTYDMIFTDIGMPVMGGLELIREVRKLYGFKFPLIVISGWGDTVINKNSGANPDYLLGKPLAYADMQKVISEIMDKKESQDTEEN